MAMEVKPLTPADAPAAAGVGAPFADAWSEEALAQSLGQEAVRGYGVFDRERLLGFALFSAAGGEASLHMLAVERAHHRRGLGLLLLTQALEHLAREGAEECYLEVRASNRGAAALYERAGFVPTGLRKNFYTHPAEDALTMCRPAGAGKEKRGGIGSC